MVLPSHRKGLSRSPCAVHVKWAEGAQKNLWNLLGQKIANQFATFPLLAPLLMNKIFVCNPLFPGKRQQCGRSIPNLSRGKHYTFFARQKSLSSGLEVNSGARSVSDMQDQITLFESTRKWWTCFRLRSRHSNKWPNKRTAANSLIRPYTT